MKAKNRAAAGKQTANRIRPKAHWGCLPTKQDFPAKHQRMDNPVCESPFTTVHLWRCPACFLVASAAARWAQAGKPLGIGATVVIQVEGYTGALPTWFAGTDFTLGNPLVPTRLYGRRIGQTAPGKAH